MNIRESETLKREIEELTEECNIGQDCANCCYNYCIQDMVSVEDVFGIIDNFNEKHRVHY